MARSKNIEKYHAILNAALTVFAQNGFHRSSVSSIAKEAGVADGTIYIYFKNKEEILVSVFQERLGYLIETSRARIQTATDAKEALKVICHTHYSELENHLDLAYVTQIELRQSSFDMRKAIGQAVKPYITLIEGVLQRGVDEGSFRSDLDLKLTRLLLFGAMDQVVTSWLMAGQKYSLTKQAEGTVQFFINGLTAK
ncbi:TetR/AcrR family transcriptional regulator [Bacillus horti]|uniref:TetR/AcrR family fatty acid metabolism transcriptional regulator n=1 Tax=Caldalkalibacillus horti TaxID=77523 RepID=A0ABT9VU88_9BACI|nr:TetR/AcrR family transcriptional regulator [Bacillus horti]MDQ0164449.1 TetR/AcrR family fatty acid metabolism transcriptional regulator [Bacillus horti]